MIRHARRVALIGAILTTALSGAAPARSATTDDPPDTRIPTHAKVFVAPMNGFETYLIAAFTTKKVPLTVVGDRDHADFEIIRASESQKSGWSATCSVRTAPTSRRASSSRMCGRVSLLFGYAGNLQDSLRAKQ